MSKILCIGEALIDRYKINDKINDQVGGAPLNVAGTLSYLKNDVYFLGAISKDHEGQVILKFLENLKIKKDLIQLTDVKTTLAFVTLDSDTGERDFTFLRGSDEVYTLPDIDFTDVKFCHFSSATALLGGELKHSYLKLAKESLKNNILVGFDPNYRDALWKSTSDFKSACKWYLENADLIKVSDVELEILTGEKNVQTGLIKLAAKNNDALICATQGPLGATYAWHGKIVYCPTLPVKEVVDTTGAGDAFIGYLINEIIKLDILAFKNLTHEDINKMIDDTNNFAKEAVKYYGALTFLDYLDLNIRIKE